MIFLRFSLAVAVVAPQSGSPTVPFIFSSINSSLLSQPFDDMQTELFK
jgi:hypothetical protein